MVEVLASKMVRRNPSPQEVSEHDHERSCDRDDSPNARRCLCLDILHELSLRQEIEKGLSQLDAGQGIKHEEAMKRFEQWLK